MNYKLKIGDYVWFQFIDRTLTARDFLYAITPAAWTSPIEYEWEPALEEYNILKKDTLQSKLLKVMYGKKL